MGPTDDDRKRRLRDLEAKIRDPRSIINVDCLLDAVQSVVADCDHTAIRKIKNVDAFVSRCKNILLKFTLYFDVTMNNTLDNITG